MVMPAPAVAKAFAFVGGRGVASDDGGGGREDGGYNTTFSGLMSACMRPAECTNAMPFGVGGWIKARRARGGWWEAVHEM